MGVRAEFAEFAEIQHYHQFRPSDSRPVASKEKVIGCITEQSRTISDNIQDVVVLTCLFPRLAMDIGQRIAEIREQSGFTQSGLARAVGTSQSAISQIEASERNPSYDMLRQIAKALGISVPHLVGAEVETLSPEEKVHFRNYRGLTDEAKRELEDFAAYLRKKHGAARKPAK